MSNVINMMPALKRSLAREQQTELDDLRKMQKVFRRDWRALGQMIAIAQIQIETLEKEISRDQEV